MSIFPIRYREPVFRPPAEAASLLLQATIGCSHNRCSYCAMYKTKRYQVRAHAEIAAELQHLARYFHRDPPRKLFLCDGDALAAPADLLLSVMREANSLFPHLRRAAVYATAANILEKSDDELRALAEQKLRLAYLGLESGADEILEFVGKGNGAADFVEAARKLRACGWQLSLIVMLGLGGRKFSRAHQEATAAVVSKMQPDFWSLLTTVAVPGTPYARAVERGEIQPLTCRELLEEMHYLIEHTDCGAQRVIFRANHVSNAYPLEGNLPRDRQRLLECLEEWICACPPHSYPAADPFLL